MNTAAPFTSKRLLSLDALRGFDMMWLIGAQLIVAELAKWLKTPTLEAFATQLQHVTWEGLQAEDLIFPLFMFLSGIAIPLSMESRIQRGDSKWQMWRKILSRTVILILLGFIYNGVFSGNLEVPRYVSVLGQIGIAWGMAASLYLVVRSPGKRLAILAGILVLITVLHLLVPVPGHGAGILTQTGAINTWLDRTFLPGRLSYTTFDPLGLLCIFSASALPIAGSLVGGTLRKPGAVSWKHTGLMFITGLAFFAAGWLCWHLGYPPIKSIWTTTFNLLGIGISLILFAGFFGIIDVAGFQKWSFPLRVIGMNSLTGYLGVRLISLGGPVETFFGRIIRLCGDAGPSVRAALTLLLMWLLLYFFYRKKWFLRV